MYKQWLAINAEIGSSKRSNIYSNLFVLQVPKMYYPTDK